ncbi:MAG: hypothetical protein IJT19_09645 [Bacteroidaceae bacterium]|nr:hypothetical protein [Bacteroidaceae bacterium]
MIKYLSILLLLLLPVASSAQNSRDLLVSDISGGSVMRQMGRERVEVKKGQHILNQDVLIIGDGVTMKLLEVKACKYYTVKGAFSGTIRNYIQRNQETCIKNITSKYMNFLVHQVFQAQNDREKGQYEDAHATVFREGDSMLDSIAAPVSPADSIPVIHTDSIPVSIPDTVPSAH